MKRSDLSRLMKKAWSLFKTAAKKAAITFSAALALAWRWLKCQAANRVKIEQAAQAAGIVEEVRSWASWQSVGRMVIHGSEAALKVEIEDPTTRSGKRLQSFFLYSDTQTAP
ncbi:MAG: hypothetical protein IJ646_08160 [Clostridia bacterium]|nr:hypothetical protein [Clostridia bacterium]